MAGIKRLTALTNFSTSSPTAVTIPSGTNRLCVAIVVSGSAPLLDGVAGTGSGASGITYWTESQLASMTASTNFTYSNPSGGYRGSYIFLENIDQTDIVGDTAGASDSVTLSYTDQQPSRYAVGRGFLVGSGTISMSGSPDSLVKHKSFSWTVTGSARRGGVGDNLSTNVINDVFPSDLATDGSYGVSIQTSSSESASIAIFNGSSKTISVETASFSLATQDPEVIDSFPRVVATATSNASTQVHSPTMPTHSEGQMLLACCGPLSYQGGTQFTPKTDGWQAIDGLDHAVFWKKATSSSESLTVDFRTTRTGSWIVHAIDGASDLYAKYTSDTDPPNLATGVTRDYLWMGVVGNYGGSATATTAPPANYTDLVTSAYSTNYHLSTFTRNLNAATENPGEPTIVVKANRRSFTLAIWGEPDTIKRTFRGDEYVSQTSNLVTGGDRLYTTDGWDGSRTNASTEVTRVTNALAGDNLTGSYYIRPPAPSQGDDLDIRLTWTGTFEELGVPAGTTVTGYVDLSLGWSIDNYNSINYTALYFGENGTGNAWEIDDGTVRTIKGVEQITGPRSYAVETFSDITGLSLASDTSITLRFRVYSNVTGSTTTRVNMRLDDIGFGVTYSIGETIDVDAQTFSLTTQPAPVNDITDVDAASLTLTTQAPNIDESISIDTASFTITTLDATAGAVDVDLLSLNLTTQAPKVNQSINPDAAVFTLGTEVAGVNEIVAIDAASFTLSTQEPQLEEVIPVGLLNFTVVHPDHIIESGFFEKMPLVEFNLTPNAPLVNDIVGVDLFTFTINTTLEHGANGSFIEFVGVVTQTQYVENTGGGARQVLVSSGPVARTLRNNYSWTNPGATTAEWIAN